jgi:hypothetical protein
MQTMLGFGKALEIAVDKVSGVGASRKLLHPGCVGQDRNRAQMLLMPPSMSNSLPTMNADSSDARKMTALAISEGLPKRPAGTCDWMELATAFNCSSEKPSLL